MGRFNEIFAKVILGIDNPARLTSFKVECSNGRVAMCLPAETDSFYFIAKIIQEIENFSITFSGVSSKTVEASKLELNTEETSLKCESDKGSTLPGAPNESNTKIKEDEFLTGYRKINCKQVREYIMTLESFTKEHLRIKFPNTASSTLNNAVHLAKKTGEIISIGRGNYSVKK